MNTPAFSAAWIRFSRSLPMSTGWPLTWTTAMSLSRRLGCRLALERRLEFRLGHQLDRTAAEKDNPVLKLLKGFLLVGEHLVGVGRGVEAEHDPVLVHRLHQRPGVGVALEVGPELRQGLRRPAVLGAVQLVVLAEVLHDVLIHLPLRP